MVVLDYITTRRGGMGNNGENAHSWYHNVLLLCVCPTFLGCRRGGDVRKHREKKIQLKINIVSALNRKAYCQYLKPERKQFFSSFSISKHNENFFLMFIVHCTNLHLATERGEKGTYVSLKT